MKIVFGTVLAVVMGLGGTAAQSEIYDCSFPKYFQSSYAVTQIRVDVRRDGIDTSARITDALTRKYANEWVRAEVVLDRADKIRLSWTLLNLPLDVRTRFSTFPPKIGYRLSINLKPMTAQLLGADEVNLGGQNFTLQGRCALVK